MAYDAFHTGSAQASGTTQAGNSPPTAPTLLDEQSLTDLTPDFQAQYNDPDVGDIANKYQIEVRDADDGGGNQLWDSGSSGTAMSNTTEGNLCPWITYVGSTLTEGATYYWRIKFWDDQPTEGAWSHTTGWATFEVNVLPEVTNVTPVQTTDGTRVVNVGYDLADAGTPGACNVSMYYKISVGGGWSICTTVMGHVGAGVALGPSKSIAWDIDTDLPATSSDTYYVQVRATDPYSNEGTGDSAVFTVDTVDPTAPGNFTFNAKTEDSITLNIGADSVEAHFAEYKMFWKQAATEPDEGDTEHHETFFDYLDFQSNTTVTVGSLSPGLDYAFILYVYDDYGNENKQAAHYTTTTDAAPTAPTNLDENLLGTMDPDFQAQFNDPDSGAQADKYRIEVRTADDGGGSLMWDSGAGGTAMTTTNEGALCPWQDYDGSALTENATYYWRIKFWDTFDNEGAWSHTTGWKTFVLAVLPVIANVVPVQRTDGSGIVDIDYDISDAGSGGPFTVSLEFSDDGGGGFNPCTTVGGHVGAGVTVGSKIATWDIGTDDPNKVDTDYQIRVIALDEFSNSGQGDSSNFSIDTLPPTAPGDFTFNARTATSITLNIGSDSVESNFTEYRMFYLNGTGRPDSGDTEHHETFFDHLDFQSNTTVTVGSLTLGQPYTFLLICYDSFGNSTEQANELTETTNAAPTASFPEAPEQRSDGSQLVDLAATLDDFNDDDLLLLVEYSTSGSGPWNKATLSGTPSLSYGTADLDNGETYQIGNVDPVETDSGVNRVDTIWDAGTDVPNVSANYWLRVTPADPIIAGTPVVTSSPLTVDTLDPVNVSLVLVGDPPDALDTTVQVTATWTETNPNENEAGVRIDGGSWQLQAGTPNTTSPGPTTVTIPAPYGDQYIEIRAKHVDDYGNETIETDVTLYYVKPATPDSPTVANVGVSSADVTPDDDDTDAAGIAPATFDHAIYISGPGGGWVDTDGTITGSEVWQDVSTWGTITVIGLQTMTAYTAATKVRNPNDTSVESDLSTAVPFATGSTPPVIQNVQVSVPGDGSKYYVLEADIQDEDDVSLTVVWLYDIGAGFVSAVQVSGDVGVVTGVPASPGWKHITANWNAGSDIPGEEIAAAEIRLQVDDIVNRVTDDSAAFILDTKDPVISATLTASEPTLTTTRLTWSAQAVEGYLSTYELYISTVSIADAVAKNGIKWDKDDDVDLGTLATLTTVVTGLTDTTPYYAALYAKDIRGNSSNEVVTESFVTASNYIISGRAQDQNGYLVPGATATPYLELTGAKAGTADTTDSQGLYSIEVIEAGPFFVVVSKTGYGSYVEDDKIAVEQP